jgi:DNA helicase-2/ATP-dependent DNA helicase PcrA
LSDQDHDADKNTKQERVTLMTVHSAKGLEFKNVFIAGMEENLFPSERAVDEPNGLEEERRLFYVALTRSCEFCMISFVQQRFRYGQLKFSRPSRFLKEIDPQYLNNPQLLEQKTRRDDDNFNGTGMGNSQVFSSFQERLQYHYQTHNRRASDEKQNEISVTELVKDMPVSRKVSLASTPPLHPGADGVPDIPPIGATILHERFGKGKVTETDSDPQRPKITVDFENEGVKILLLRFARFTVLK